MLKNAKSPVKPEEMGKIDNRQRLTHHYGMVVSGAECTVLDFIEKSRLGMAPSLEAAPRPKPRGSRRFNFRLLVPKIWLLTTITSDYSTTTNAIVIGGLSFRLFESSVSIVSRCAACKFGPSYHNLHASTDLVGPSEIRRRRRRRKAHGQLLSQRRKPWSSGPGADPSMTKKSVFSLAWYF
jgi:hypothetical protein